MVVIAKLKMILGSYFEAPAFTLQNIRAFRSPARPGYGKRTGACGRSLELQCIRTLVRDWGGFAGGVASPGVGRTRPQGL